VNAFIDEHRARCGVEPICSALQVAPSAYRLHAARRRLPGLRPERAKRDALLLPEVQRVFDQNLQVYGADKVWRQLLREGLEVARCTVERLMRVAGLRGVRRGKSVRTTVPDAKAPCPLDRVNRQFQAQRPNELWVADFTYVSTWQGFVYVAFVVDVFARYIVGWRVSTSMQTDFVLDALEQALYARRPGRQGGLVHHSDRGSQYVSIRYSERLAEAGIEPSVGSTGDSYDNALAETINGLYKAEIIHRRGPWKTREAVELATLEWVSWFNKKRLLEPIGYIPPAEAEANYWRQHAPVASTTKLAQATGSPLDDHFKLERELNRAGGDLALPGQAIAALRGGLATLKTSPFTCRKAGQSPFLRELIVPFGRSGYVALFEIEDDRQAAVLALRHQREDDYH
jgi:putative transposase